MRSQYSRPFLFAVASSLLVSGLVSSKLEKTFQLFAEKSEIRADFSPLFSLAVAHGRFEKSTSFEIKQADDKITRDILESRSLALIESPILVPVQAVREIYGPDPYRYVRVRFDQNYSGIVAARGGRNWIQVSLARKFKISKQLAVQTNLRNIVREVESLKLARIHSQIESQMNSHILDIHRDEIQSEYSSTTVLKTPVIASAVNEGPAPQEAQPIETAPVSLLPAAFVQHDEGKLVDSLQSEKPAVVSDSSQHENPSIQPAELDAVPLDEPKKKTKGKIIPTPLVNNQAESKPSVVTTIRTRLAEILKVSKEKPADLGNQTIEKGPQSVEAPASNIQYEPLAQNQAHLDDLDSHIQTIEYSDLPDAAHKALKLSQAIRVEKEEEPAKTDAKAAALAGTETTEISKRVETKPDVLVGRQSEPPKEVFTKSAETNVESDGENSEEDSSEPKVATSEEKEIKSGPVLVAGFNSAIQVTQSSAGVRTPAIGELVEKVVRLRGPALAQPEVKKSEAPPAPKKQEVANQNEVSPEPKLIKKPEEIKPVQVIETNDSITKADDSISISQSVTTAAPELKKTCDTALIGQEAFSTQSSQEDSISVCRRVLSLEGTQDGKGSRWWEVRESVNHWPTIIRQKPDSALKKNDRIPILSLNTVKILSTLSKAQTQSKAAGIIVGEVPPGIQVSLSGRSESVIYFDAHLQIVNPQDTKTARYFTFLNVEPGLPLLNVTLKSGNGSGTIALMVQSGATTYVRVPSPRLRKITGTVYSATSSKPLAVSKANIQVVGQNGKQAVTDKRGNFELNNVLTFDDHPLYLDVSSGSREFRHRYRVSPDETKGVTLFRFEAAQVSHWIQQLEGGVSPMSGLIVGALPSLVSGKSSKSEFEVKIGTLDRKSILRPEVYGLGAGDILQDTNRIQAKATRFLSVQVPEGPNVPSAFDLKGNMIWSETVFAQPGVVNVVAQ